MQIFCATFRIHEDAGYKERYESTIAAIKRCCHGQYWDQPTSYFLFENPSTAAKIAAWVRDNSQFATAKDVLLITNLSEKSWSVLGKVQNKAVLEDLMSKR
jgi:hypothetical protein